MKINFSIKIIFLIFLILQTTNLIKINKKTVFRKTNLLQNQLTQLWKDLFMESRGSSCSAINLKSKIQSTPLNSKNEISNQHYLSNSKFSWIKKWGYGELSYLFDYLDPIFQKTATKLFIKLYDETMNESNKETDKIKDPFAGYKITNKYVYNLSANSIQIKSIMKKWNWFIEPDSIDYYTDLITSYDIDHDGRLNPRELVLAAIMHNRNSISDSSCINCFSELAQTINAIFSFLDCNDKGTISAKTLWNKLPSLKRNTNMWNIFAYNNSENIRTSAINDFILKNGNSITGEIDRDNFRTGILLGLWDRQTTETGIIEGDSRNLKTLRWSDNGTIDNIAYNFMKEKAIQKKISDLNNK